MVGIYDIAVVVLGPARARISIREGERAAPGLQIDASSITGAPATGRDARAILPMTTTGC